MKFNYFKIYEDKYKTRLSMKSPIVIRLDGKGICKNKEIDMLNENEGGFAYALKETAKILSRKFNASSIVASDEINLVIHDGNLLKLKYSSLDCQKVASFISQDVFYYFNKFYDGELIYFDARCFNIPKDKCDSYNLYRIKTARNVYAIYYAKKILSYRERKGKNLAQLERSLNRISPDFTYRSDYCRVGALYENGEFKSLNHLVKLYYPGYKHTTPKKSQANICIFDDDISCDDDILEDF